MGSACCVAVRDKTIVNGSNSKMLHRNIQHSPTWSLRCDHPGRVAGEETTVSWLSDGISNGSEIKYESAHAAEEGSPLYNFQRRMWQKSPVSEGTAGFVRTPASDQSISRNISMDVSLEQVKESPESLEVSCSSPTKISLSLPFTSSLSTSPLSSQSHLHPATLTPTRWPRQSPGHQLLCQVSDSRIPGLKSPNSYSVSEERPVLPSWSNESTRGSHGGSSDGCSMQAFSELTTTSHRENWSFDSESFDFNREKITKSSSQISASPSVDLQTCGVCSKLLTDKSSWGSQKIMPTNELSVAAILICGHVYHAECLEHMTPEIDKYDPGCLVCTFGEKQTLELFEKALKAEMDLNVKKSKRSKNWVVDREGDGDSDMFDRMKGSAHVGKGPKMASSSSMRSSLRKPFLRRHFSFGSKESRYLSENNYTRKKGWFWAKSSKV